MLNPEFLAGLITGVVFSIIEMAVVIVIKLKINKRK